MLFHGFTNEFFRVLTFLLTFPLLWFLLSLVLVWPWQEQQICCIDSFFVAWQGAGFIKLKLQTSHLSEGSFDAFWATFEFFRNNLCSTLLKHRTTIYYLFPHTHRINIHLFFSSRQSFIALHSYPNTCYLTNRRHVKRHILDDIRDYYQKKIRWFTHFDGFNV